MLGRDAEASGQGLAEIGRDAAQRAGRIAGDEERARGRRFDNADAQEAGGREGLNWSQAASARMASDRVPTMRST